ncbi:hypothetical protein [Deinococcus carri]|uniref:hypothetical protein n=1 Tax=Deinococcus carri TaxID=1211323 RepID=UPI0031F08883
MFGRHDGVRVSSDQRATWQERLDKANFGAMNIQQAEKTMVIAGHNVYATSPSGKRRTNRNPRGLGGTDLPGYAVARNNLGLTPPGKLGRASVAALTAA